MKILAVIDMQNDFIDGSLGTKEAVGIVDNVAAKIRQCREEGYKIYFTRDTHQPDYMETQEGRNLPVMHCIEGSQGWQIRDGLDTEGCTIVDKPAFGSLELAELIKKDDPEEITLIGLCTDICVISNAMIIKAAMPEVPVKVVENCCAGVTPESHRNALEAMKVCQITVEE